MSALSPARVGVLHAPGAAAGLRELVLAARGRVDLVLLVRRSVAERNPELVTLGGRLAELVVVDDDGLGGAVERLRLDGLTTFHDEELEYSDAALTALGLPGAPGVHRPWDKLNQRRRFAATGVSSVCAAPVESPSDLVLAVELLGLPAVLKPRRSAASVGLSFLDHRQAVDTELRSRGKWAGLLLEQLIPRADHPSGRPWLGDYVSVETVSVAGDHRHLAVFDKLPLSIARQVSRFTTRETGDVLPDRLDEPLRTAVRQRTSAALDALGVTWRISHTELRVSSAGIDVIEVNGRLGGEVVRMVSRAGGSNLVQIGLELAVGRCPQLSMPCATETACCLYVPFPDRDGTVQSRVSRSMLRGLPGLAGVDEVAEHGRPRSATGFRAAKVLLTGAHAADLEQVVLGAVHHISDLFAADGLRDDEWVRRLLGPTMCAPDPVASGRQWP